MKFSFIIPAYNSASTILRVFEALERQLYNDFEVIVIDDRSTDNLIDVVINYIKESKLVIKLISMEINSGPSAARLSGINHSKGEYICFIDSDDYISDNYTYELNAVIHNDDYPDLICFGSCQIIGNKKIVNKQKIYQFKDDLIALSSGSLCRFIYKQDLLKRFPFPLINNAEDIAVIPLIIGFADKISYCDNVYYYYIHNNNSLSSNYSKEVSSNFVRSFDYTLSFLTKPYKKSIEFHGIKTVLYGAILNGIKAKMTNLELNSIIVKFEKEFPNWINNNYIQSYSLRKRIFLILVYHKWFSLMRIYITVHNLLLRFL